MTTGFVVSLAVRVFIIALIAFAVNTINHRASAAERHLVWMLSVVTIVALPFGLLFLPSLRVIPVSSVATGAWIAESHKDNPALRSLVAAIWIAGTVICLARLIAAHFRTRSIISRASSLDTWSHATGVAVRSSSDAAFTFSAGVFKPVIVLDTKALNWSDDKIRATLLHESEHVRRHDSASLLLSQIAVAMYWWHPAVWLISREACAERERACDDAVLRSGVSATGYGSHLAANAVVRKNHLAAAMLSHNNGLKDRIASLLDQRRNRAGVDRRRAIATTMYAIFVGVLTASASEMLNALPSMAPAVVIPAPQAPQIKAPPVPAKQHKIVSRPARKYRRKASPALDAQVTAMQAQIKPMQTQMVNVAMMAVRTAQMSQTVLGKMLAPRASKSQ